MSEPSVDLEVLTRPFPASAIKQRAGGGGRMLDYVEGHTVIHRLNEATGNAWEMQVKAISRQDLGQGRALMTAHVALTLPGLGTREHIGIQEVTANAGDLVKGAVTDALKKAATLFGVGLELYGPDYEAGEVAAAAPRPVAAARPQQSAPARQQAAPASGDVCSEPQRKFLFAMMNKAGMNKDEYVALLEQVGYPGDDRNLTKDQASRMITWLKMLAGEPIADDDRLPEGVARPGADAPVPPDEIPF